MRTSVKLLLLALSAAGLVLGGVGWFGLGPGAGSGYAFRTARAEKGDLAATISATGTIEPEEVINVGAQVAAQVVKFGEDPSDSTRTVDYCSVVHSGTLLAQLDDSLFKAQADQAQAALEVAQAQVDQAQANLDRAQADLGQMQAQLVQSQRDWERVQRLLPLHAVADLDYDTAKATYETARANVGVDQANIVQARAAKVQADKALNQARASLRQAQVNLGYTRILSPVEGIIVDRQVNVGQTVVASLTAPNLFLIAKDLKRLQVWASVNEADVGSIRKGQKVTFTVDAYPNETFEGTVDQVRLNASMTQNVVTYTVVVTTNNPVDRDHPNGRLLPYLTANLQFELQQRKDVLLVPNAALRWRPSTPGQVAPDARAAYLSALNRRAAARAEGAANAEKEKHDRGVVWVEDNGLVRPVQVKMGISDGAATEVTGGDLKDGARLVIGENHAGTGDGGSNPFAPKLSSRR